jgi:hypothetical protein
MQLEHGQQEHVHLHSFVLSKNISPNQPQPDSVFCLALSQSRDQAKAIQHAVASVCSPPTA